jgi:hypothetical protein
MSEVESSNEEKWYRAGHPLPGALIRCRHRVDRECKCVTRFNVDKNCPITEKQTMVIAATYELNKLKCLDEQDDQKYELLSQIIQCEENKKDIYMGIYKKIYGSLLQREPIQDPEPNPPSPPLPVQKRQRFNGFQTRLIILIVFVMVPILYFLLWETQISSI